MELDEWNIGIISIVVEMTILERKETSQPKREEKSQAILRKSIMLPPYELEQCPLARRYKYKPNVPSEKDFDY